MHFPTTWQELIILFSGIQGIILVVAIGWKLKPLTPANKLLIWFIVALIFLLFSGLSTTNSYLSFLNLAMGYIGDTVSYLYGPLLYLYTRKLLFSFSNGKNWLHFIPAIVFFFINSTASIVDPGVLFSKVFFYVVGVTVFIQIFIYLYLSYRTIRQYQQQAVTELSYTQPVNYLLTIVYFVIGCVFLFLADFINNVLGFPLDMEFFDYSVCWSIMSLLTFLLGYYAITSPELFRLVPSETNGPSMSAEETKSITNRLIALMETDKLFKNQDLSLSLVADRLGVRKEIVSRVINHDMDTSFYQMVNEYRVQEFEKLVQEDETNQITLLGHAFSAGFKSKTTFYKSFKTITGKVPSSTLNDHVDK